MLGADDVRFYKENGYLVLHDFFRKETIESLGRVADTLIAKARDLTESNDLYDLESSHTPQSPRVRRINKPTVMDRAFYDLARDPRLLDALADVLGPEIRLSHPAGKVNVKAAGYGAAVEWHQDWTSYPHTNDALLTVSIPMDDCLNENGPLLVIPGSHKGKVFDHHANGFYSAGIDPEASVIDFSKAVALTGRAGMITFHHVRTIHGSALNHSPYPRRLFLLQYAAVDAWPILGISDFDKFNEGILRGTPTTIPRMEALPVRIPYPRRASATVYQAQEVMARRHFAVLENPVAEDRSVNA
jgi:ectoine hydroxylase-related dioxygenase (phytanoyl-CoA dioxygenase family)